ncbi:MAG TPA: enoyl-CoA hydratase/isomerase family protein [Planctomycetota bacterium]|nr:enoyl-CoA hydratase/isomerase family protein [Planctomycetota bacterium]
MIEREVQGDVAILRLAHGKASALDLELLVALDEALQAEERSQERALVLTGSGTIFCAGVDLKRIVQGRRGYIEAFLPALERAFARLFFLEKPVVAAINGHAIAGGAVIALACDQRLLARGKGMVGTPELKVGVPFPFLALEILRASLGLRLAATLVVEGRNYSGEEALAQGMVHELVGLEALMPRALESAASLARIPSESFRLSKRWLRRPSKELWERNRAESEAATLEAWCGEPVLRAVEDYVARTLR